MRRSHTLLTTPLAVAASLPTAVADECGFDSANGGRPAPSLTTHVAEHGYGPLKCVLTLESLHPVNKQLIATLTVSCNFPIGSGVTSLVIQGRPLGGNDTQWDDVDDPVTTVATSDISLTYTVPCITSLEYRASASIDAETEDGTPVTATDTTLPRSLRPCG
jgi:hypothetical protein